MYTITKYIKSYEISTIHSIPLCLWIDFDNFKFNAIYLYSTWWLNMLIFKHKLITYKECISKKKINTSTCASLLFSTNNKWWYEFKKFSRYAYIHILQFLISALHMYLEPVFQWREWFTVNSEAAIPYVFWTICAQGNMFE